VRGGDLWGIMDLSSEKHGEMKSDCRLIVGKLLSLWDEFSRINARTALRRIA